MSLLDNVAPAPRKVMTLFYVVDTSGSMCGSKIGSVNSAMEEAITSDLPEISAANDDAEIKVAIMQFSSGCSWITPQSGPIAIGDVIWNDLNAGGVTDLGAACKDRSVCSGYSAVQRWRPHGQLGKGTEAAEAE